MQNTKKGFSLLEVMLALLLFGVGFVSLLQILNTGLVVSGQSGNTVIAANLTQERIEWLRNASYGSLASETPAATVSGFPAFKRQVLVGDLTPVQTGLKQVTVTVSWTGGDPIVMVTYVSNI